MTTTFTLFRSQAGLGTDGDITSDYGQQGRTAFIDNLNTTITQTDADFNGEFPFRYLFTLSGNATFDLGKISTDVELGHSVIIMNLSAHSTGYVLTVREDSGTTLTQIPPQGFAFISALAAGVPDTWSVSLIIGGIPINFVYVDDVYGNDTTGEVDRFDLPFLTMAAADAAASAGDVFFVRPGTYTVSAALTTSGTNASGTNTTWLFSPGAIVTITSSDPFPDGVDIVGHADFIGSGAGVIDIINTATGSLFDANSVTTGRIAYVSSSGDGNIRVNEMADSRLLISTATDNISVQIKRITRVTGAAENITITNGTPTIQLDIWEMVDSEMRIDEVLSDDIKVFVQYVDETAILVDNSTNVNLFINHLNNTTHSIDFTGASTDNCYLSINRAIVADVAYCFSDASLGTNSYYINSCITSNASDFVRLSAASHSNPKTLMFNTFTNTDSTVSRILLSTLTHVKGNYISASRPLSVTGTGVNSTIDIDDVIDLSTSFHALSVTTTSGHTYFKNNNLSSASGGAITATDSIIADLNVVNTGMNANNTFAVDLTQVTAEIRFHKLINSGIGGCFHATGGTTDLMGTYAECGGATITANNVLTVDRDTNPTSTTFRANVKQMTCTAASCVIIGNAGTGPMNASIYTDEALATGVNCLRVLATSLGTDTYMFGGRWKTTGGTIVPIDLAETGATYVFDRLSSISSTAAAGVNHAGTGITIQHQGDTLAQVAFTGTISSIGSPVVTNAALT